MRSQHLAPVTGKRKHRKKIGLLQGIRTFFLSLFGLCRTRGWHPNPWLQWRAHCRVTPQQSSPCPSSLQRWGGEGEVVLWWCSVSPGEPECEPAVSYYPLARHKDVNTIFQTAVGQSLCWHFFSQDCKGGILLI